MNKEEIISSGLLELYALGIASQEETMAVESCLKNYPELRDELNSIEETMEQYSQGSSITPSSNVKDNIFNNISDFSESNQIAKPSLKGRVYQIPPFFKLMAAVVITLLVVNVILTWSYYNKYQAL